MSGEGEERGKGERGEGGLEGNAGSGLHGSCAPLVRAPPSVSAQPVRPHLPLISEEVHAQLCRDPLVVERPPVKLETGNKIIDSAQRRRSH